MISQRGWVVKYKNGTVIAEWEFDRPFSQLPSPGDIDSVAMVFDGRHWVIAGKQHYFSQKRESMFFGPGFIGGNQLESRTIGYWENGQQVKYTLNENTGEFYGPYVESGR